MLEAGDAQPGGQQALQDWEKGRAVGEFEVPPLGEQRPHGATIQSTRDKPGLRRLTLQGNQLDIKTMQLDSDVRERAMKEGASAAAAAASTVGSIQEEEEEEDEEDSGGAKK